MCVEPTQIIEMSFINFHTSHVSFWKPIPLETNFYIKGICATNLAIAFFSSTAASGIVIHVSGQESFFKHFTNLYHVSLYKKGKDHIGIFKAVVKQT